MYVCQCGRAFEDNPSTLRRLRDPSKADPETPRLCWICKRLHNSAVLQAGRTVREMVAVNAMLFK